MCKAKPGPRCSDHTAQEWRKTYETLNSLQDQFNEAENMLADAENHHYHVNTPESAKIEQQWKQEVNRLEQEVNLATDKNIQAMLAYYATPGGQNQVKHNIDQLGNQTYLEREGYMLPNGDWADVSYKELRNTPLNTTLSHAVNHRTRQKRAYDQLNSDRISLPQKRAIINRLLTEAEAEKTFYTEQQQSSQKLIPILVQHCYESHNSPEQVERLRATKREHYAAGVSLTYLNMYLNDLKTASKQIPVYNTLKPTTLLPPAEQPLTYEKIQKLMQG